jgi:5-methylcytosine-specific restriction endonuclease McrA
LIQPWDECDVWKNQSQFYTWLRGKLREIWKDNPVRITFKKEALRPVSSEEKAQKVFHPSTKNVGECSFCKVWFAGSKLEVDHIQQIGSCKDFEDAIEFLKGVAFVPKKNMQLVCKPCHKIKSYAERQGLSFEDASIEKQAITFCKQSIQDQGAFFEREGFTIPSNATLRRKAYKEWLTKKPN